MKSQKAIREVINILQQTLSEIEELEESGDSEALIQAKINILYYILEEE